MNKIVLLFISVVVCTAVIAQSEQKEGDRMEAEGNYSGAEIMYRLCMEQNDTCLLKLIRLIYKKKIEPQFENELFQLTLPLAMRGNPEAQYYLGVMWNRGIGGVPQDTDVAMRWLQRSSDQGYEPAQTELAVITELVMIAPKEVYKPTKKIVKQNDWENQVSLGFGFGGVLGRPWKYHSRNPSISISYERHIQDFGIGGVFGYTSADDYYTSKFVLIGVQIFYHKQFFDNIDTYIGAMSGYNGSGHGGHYSYALFVGARYFVDDWFGFFAEVGYGYTYINVGFSCKF